MLKSLPPPVRVLILLILLGAATGIRWYATRQHEDSGAPPSTDRFAFSSLPPNVQQRVSRAKLVDRVESSGISYRWVAPARRPLNILETIGRGCALFDYNNDGKLDVLCVGDRLALYQGDGQGHFTDVTHAAGLDKFRGYYLGCAVGDYDNDGFDDIYISGYHEALLLHNEPAAVGRQSSVAGRLSSVVGRRFRDGTRQMGLKPQPWGTSCAWGDVDGDGFLDLYVCNYVDFGPKGPELCTYAVGKDKYVKIACEPMVYQGLKGVLYHNIGGRRFQDVTHVWGADKTRGVGLGVAFGDFEGSGHLGIAVANDEQPGDLFLNTGKLPLRNVGADSGTSTDHGHVHGGMGIEWADYDNDGKQDLYVNTFDGQAKNLYRNLGGGLFEDVCRPLGIWHYTFHHVAFGCKFLDVDNDGWLDLLIASGYTADNIAEYFPDRTFRDRTQLLYNLDGGRFADASEPAGLSALSPIVGRGVATGDYDNDGRVDALVVDIDGRPQLLHNETAQAGHWLSLKLVGTHCNRDAYGAVVTASAGGRKLMRVCHADGSFMSSSDPRVHVGLGAATSADVEIRWPDGKTTRHPRLPVDRVIRIAEP